MSTISIVDQNGADARWVIRDRIRFMGDLDGTKLSVIEVEVPPQSGTPPHRHASPEIFRILEGEITFGLFGDGPPREVVASAGTVVTVPAYAPHNYTNASGKPAAMLVVLEQDMITFFRDLGREEAPEQGPPSEAEIAEIMDACRRHNIEILGGPAPSAG